MRRPHLAMPWSRHSELYSSPQRLIIKLELGEAPDVIPTTFDVRRGTQPAAERTGHGALDRILRELGGTVRIVRVHSAAAAHGQFGSGHRGFDDVEHITGLSRTFRVDFAEPRDVDTLVVALRQLSMVESVSPHYLCALPFAAPPPAIDLDSAWSPRQQINAAEAMAYEPGDRAVILAIVDTGVAHTHAELGERIRAGYDTVQLGKGDVALGIQLLGDQADEDNDPEDEVGHGTSCAAIIGALGDHIPPGLGGETSILPIRVLGSARFPGNNGAVGVGAISDIDAGLKIAIDLGAKVLNMSFGTPASALDANDPLPHADVVRYGLARGCIMVAASGNSGREEVFYPAAFDGVIAVGAVGADLQPSAFSTRGAHVALAAPGERIATAGLSGYQLVTGTSFAAPFVAATAALLVGRAARRAFPLDGPTARRILCESARPWSRGQGHGHGVGILDAYAALRHLDREIDRTTPGQGSRIGMNGAQAP